MPPAPLAHALLCRLGEAPLRGMESSELCRASRLPAPPRASPLDRCHSERVESLRRRLEAEAAGRRVKEGDSESRVDRGDFERRLEERASERPLDRQASEKGTAVVCASLHAETPLTDLPLAPPLSELVSRYEALLQGASETTPLACLTEAARKLEAGDESTGDRCATRKNQQLRSFCEARLLCGQDKIVPQLNAQESQEPAARLADRKLRLLDVQIQMRLALMTLDSPTEPKSKNTRFKDVKKFVQLYAVQLQANHDIGGAASRNFSSHAEPMDDTAHALPSHTAEEKPSHRYESVGVYVREVLLPQFNECIPDIIDRLIAQFRLNEDTTTENKDCSDGAGDLAKPNSELELLSKSNRREESPQGTTRVNSQHRIGSLDPLLTKNASNSHSALTLRRRPSRASGQVSVKEHHQQKLEQLNALHMVTHPKRGKSRTSPSKGLHVARVRGFSTSNSLQNISNAGKRKRLQEGDREAVSPPAAVAKNAAQTERGKYSSTFASPIATPTLRSRTVLAQETPSRPAASSQQKNARRRSFDDAILVQESPLVNERRKSYRSPRMMLR